MGETLLCSCRRIICIKRLKFNTLFCFFKCQMLAFPWWQQKCSRVAARVAGVRSLSCRSGGDLGGSSLGLENLVSGW